MPDVHTLLGLSLVHEDQTLSPQGFPPDDGGMAFPFQKNIPKGPGAGPGVTWLFDLLEIPTFVTWGNNADAKSLTFSTGIGNPGGIPMVLEPCADPGAGRQMVSRLTISYE